MRGPSGRKAWFFFRCSPIPSGQRKYAVEALRIRANGIVRRRHGTKRCNDAAQVVPVGLIQAGGVLDLILLFRHRIPGNGDNAIGSCHRSERNHWRRNSEDNSKAPKVPRRTQIGEIRCGFGGIGRNDDAAQIIPCERSWTVRILHLIVLASQGAPGKIDIGTSLGY